MSSDDDSMADDRRKQKFVFGRGPKPVRDANASDNQSTEDSQMADDKRFKPKVATASDAPPPFKGMPEVGKGPAQDGAITKVAMDTAIKAAVEAERKNQRAIQEALEFVRPRTGALSMAFDSADKVYEKALNMLGVKTDGIHPSAFKTILGLHPVPSKPPSGPKLAQDGKPVTVEDFDKRFPEAARIKILG